MKKIRDAYREGYSSDTILGFYFQMIFTLHQSRSYVILYLIDVLFNMHLIYTEYSCNFCYRVPDPSYNCRFRSCSKNICSLIAWCNKSNRARLAVSFKRLWRTSCTVRKQGRVLTWMISRHFRVDSHFCIEFASQKAFLRRFSPPSHAPIRSRSSC